MTVLFFCIILNKNAGKPINLIGSLYNKGAYLFSKVTHSFSKEAYSLNKDAYSFNKECLLI